MKLSEMTLEELWQLFPICLTEHQEAWKSWYQEEEETLRRLLPDPKLRFHHIGSTAIEGIWAKPIIDILVEGPSLPALQESKTRLTEAGYLCMADHGPRISLNKGYTEVGFAERVFHIHLRLAGDCDELYFRDYLNAHPEAAKDYEALKLGLWRAYEHDRDGYTAMKTTFVKEHTALAKKLFRSPEYRPIV